VTNQLRPGIPFDVDGTLVGDDHELLGRLSTTGFPMARGHQAAVRTSTRIRGHGPEGLADFLRLLQAAPVTVG
jgi:hypothetical protein